jgi:hypothetical protein
VSYLFDQGDAAFEPAPARQPGRGSFDQLVEQVVARAFGRRSHAAAEPGLARLAERRLGLVRVSAATPPRREGRAPIP